MRFVLAFSLVLLVICCKQKDKKNTSNPNQVEKPAEDKYAKYKAFVSSLDTANAESTGKAAKEFQQLFKDADKKLSDSAFDIFNQLYSTIEKNINEALIKDTTDYTSYAPGAADKPSTNPKAKQFADQLKDNGYTFDLVEGSAYIRKDYNYLPDFIYNNVSPVMQQYLEQLRKESNEGFVDDGGLLIKPLKLAQRILFWEYFLNANPSFKYVSIIQDEQRSYKTFLLEGLDNTPLYEYDTKKLSADFKEAFEYVLKEAPVSNLAGMIAPYYEAVKTKNTKKAAALLKDYRRKQLILDFEG